MEQLTNLRTVPDIFRTKTPSLARIKKEQGEKAARAYLMAWIVAMNDMLNVKYSMNDVQVKYTAQLILQEFPLLTVADIKFVFDGVMSGRYGKTYHQLDSLTICGWFREHWEQRLNAAEQESMMKHSRTKDTEDSRAREVKKLRDVFKNSKIQRK